MLGDLSQGRKHVAPGSSELTPLPHGVRDACKRFLPFAGVWSITLTQQQEDNSPAHPASASLGTGGSQELPALVLMHRLP